MFSNIQPKGRPSQEACHRGIRWPESHIYTYNIHTHTRCIPAAYKVNFVDLQP